MKGFLTRKVGMTRIFSQETGEVTPVTVLEVVPNTVLQVKQKEKDGYSALVLGIMERKTSSSKSKEGKPGKNKNFKFIREVRDPEGEFKKGDILSLEGIGALKNLKVTGISKGKGFAGVMKRHNFHGGPETHGSVHHRESGSVGSRAKPGRIMRGHKMAGHMGSEKVTLRVAPVVSVDIEKNLIALKGSVPGANNSFIFVYGE